jgi:hypothetical protein
MHELLAIKTQNEQMAAELKRLIPLAVEETREGAFLATTKYAVTGRKPRKQSRSKRPGFPRRWSVSSARELIKISRFKTFRV